MDSRRLAKPPLSEASLLALLAAMVAPATAPLVAENDRLRTENTAQRAEIEDLKTRRPLAPGRPA